MNITVILRQCMGYILSSDIYSVARATSTSISGLGDHIAILPVVGRCQSHLGALSLNSPRSKTSDLSLEFRRYLS